MADLCQPDTIQWLTGSDEEDAELKRKLMAGGMFTELDQAKWPAASTRGRVRTTWRG